MSELKYQLMLNKDMSWVPCYLKSEADKVIARHKYKRCLAMASNCALQKKKLKLLNLEDDFVEIVKIRAVKIQRWDKWCNRWLSLAGKFDKS